jgi:hypothetical protein
MSIRFSIFTPVLFRMMSLLLVKTQDADTIMNWWPEETTDYPYTFGSDPWSESSEDESVIYNPDATQSDLYVLEPEPVDVQDPHLFDLTDPNAPVIDFHDTFAFADIDLLASDCTSDGVQTISKRKKGKMCPTTLNPSSSQVKEPECLPERDICPAGKTAMCCTGEKQAWNMWFGFSVGKCINCTHFFHACIKFLFLY